MAAYDAVVTLKYAVLRLIEHTGLVLSKYRPSFLEILQFTAKELKSFQEFVEGLWKKSRMRMKVPLQQIVEATREFTQEVGFYVPKIMEHPQLMLDESEAIVDLDQVCRDIQDFTQAAHSFIDTLQNVKEEYLKVQDEDEAHVDSGGKMVGLSDVYGELKRNIISHKVHDLVLVSLIGMAGVGKTTLAKKLFEDLDVSEWFEYCVWVTVGLNFQPSEITRAIQTQMGIDDDDMLMEGYLRKKLEDKLCLIVLDDVWDLELCGSYIESLFLTDVGNKVLITTRIRDLSLIPHINVRLLDKQESWHLLCDKVFAQNSCPLELEKAGKLIAEKCDGLPLTIVIVANLLSKIPESLWIQVATQKNHQLFVDAYDEISKVLYPSYAHLSEDLKLCFLYMGVFPQNYKIPRSKLINLWIVEKVIEKSSFQTSEVSGVEVLQRLARQSFVMIYQTSTIFFDYLTERIKICGLHTIWWHFCYKEARKINFFHIMDLYTDALEDSIKGQRRLTIHNNILFGIKVVYKLLEENCAFTTHSLLCLGPYHQYPVPICYGLKLLKKLDALQVRFYHFPLEVLELVKLRYLALTCNASLPPSISKLWKLQYLIVHQHLSMKSRDLSYLPVEIWDMKRMKHRHVAGSDLPDVGGTFLPNLLTLSDVSFNSCTSGVVRGVPNLKKLGIRIDLMPNEVEPFYCFDHISNFSELESLKCIVVNPACNKVVAPLVPLPMFSLTLKKLYLSGLGYPWEEVRTISSLPNLEVLKLRSGAFQGPQWVVEDYDFPKLCCLIMEDIDLVILIGGYQSFKCLKKVSIQHCYNLKKLCLRRDYELVTRSIKVIDCNPQVGREIQKSIINVGKIPNHYSICSSWNS